MLSADFNIFLDIIQNIIIKNLLLYKIIFSIKKFFFDFAQEEILTI